MQIRLKVYKVNNDYLEAVLNFIERVCSLLQKIVLAATE